MMHDDRENITWAEVAQSFFLKKVRHTYRRELLTILLKRRTWVTTGQEKNTPSAENQIYDRVSCRRVHYVSALFYTQTLNIF